MPAKRKSLFIMLLGSLLIGPAALQGQTKSTVFGTMHDIASLGGGCGSCHIPHQPTAKGEVLLWNRNFPTTASFGIYSTPTLNSTPLEVGGTYSASSLPTGAKIYTVLCLSCHDGLTTSTVIGPTDEHAIGNPTNSDGLRNDHPVNLAYNPSADPGLEPVATVQAGAVRLFSDGTNLTVQCASCHDVHNSASISPFLRVANTNTKAGLCTTCHK